MRPVTYSSLKGKSVKYTLVSFTIMVHGQHTSHIADFFDIHIGILFSKTFIQRQKKKKIKKLKAYLGFANETRADSKIVDNSLYNKKQKANYLY